MNDPVLPRTRGWWSSRLSGTLLVALAPQVLLTASAIAQRQFDELEFLPLPKENDLARGGVAGDVDADGDLDLIVAGDPVAKLYLNSGAAVFADATPTQMPPTAVPTQSVAVGDVDGDGDVDAVFGRSQGNALYLNDGTGTFIDVSASHMPPDADVGMAVALGDVDGDGDLDAVFAQRWSSSPGGQDRLYLNDGSGRFTDVTASQMPVDTEQSTDVAMVDVNGDGDLDLVFARTNLSVNVGQNRVYINDGSGVFSDESGTRMPSRSDNTECVAVGDVDGDGDPDLVFGNSLQNRLYLNDGAGVFIDGTATRLPVEADLTSAVALTDFDRDGDLDLIAANYWRQQSQLYLNDGTGAFVDVTATHVPATVEKSNDVLVEDLDGDQDPDVVFANASQDRLFVNDGTGVLSDPARHRMPRTAENNYAVVVGDVDRDGDSDILFAAGAPISPFNGQRNRLYLNDGYGYFEDVSGRFMPDDEDETYALALGDVDGDGDLDLVAGNYGSPDRLSLNDGTGRFRSVPGAFPGTHSTMDVELGDVDGDGDLDAVFADFGQRGTRLFLNNGVGVFQDVTASNIPSVWMRRIRGIELGDVDADGDLDLVVGSYGYFGGGPTRLFTNDGLGLFTDVTSLQMPSVISNTADTALGDVDGDGDLDLVLAEDDYWTLGRNRLLLNDGAGTFTEVTATQMPGTGPGSMSRRVAIGDVDGDSDLDLVFTNRYTRSVLYLNNGIGWFSRSVERPAAVHLERGRRAGRPGSRRGSRSGAGTAPLPQHRGAERRSPARHPAAATHARLGVPARHLRTLRGWPAAATWRIHCSPPPPPMSRCPRSAPCCCRRHRSWSCRRSSSHSQWAWRPSRSPCPTCRPSSARPSTRRRCWCREASRGSRTPRSTRSSESGPARRGGGSAPFSGESAIALLKTL